MPVSTLEERDELRRKLDEARRQCNELLAAGKLILAGPVDEPQIDLTGEWETGLYCGLEDRGYQADGYCACRYGFEKGVNRALEWADGVIDAAIAKATKGERGEAG